MLAWGIAAVGFAALRLSSSRSWSLGRVLAGVTAFVATTAVVYAATGKRDLFFLYENSLDYQSGDVAGAEVAQTPTLSLGLVPVKLVQLFLDPCYLSLCEISDYEVGGGAGTNLDFWSLPLAIQLPALFVLPLSIIGTGWLVVRAVRHRARTSGRRELRLLVEMTVAATGLTLGYAASSLTGPSHLRYGFARDFLLASLLAAVVIVVLASIAGWRLVARRRGGLLSPDAAFVVGAVVSAVLVVAGVTYARSAGLPRFESRHLERVVYTASCAGGECDVQVAATAPDGQPIDIPEASTLTFGCGSDEPSFSLYVAELTAGVRVPSECQSPRLVAGWPTVMGLPPGSFELAAVDVRNV